MFTHIVVGSNDIPKAQKFYDPVLGTIGVGPAIPAGPDKLLYPQEGAPFAVFKPFNGEVACFANGGTVGFVAPDIAAVDAFHAAALANGGSCEGQPGDRPQAPMKTYAAYVRDPDGNKLGVFYMYPAE